MPSLFPGRPPRYILAAYLFDLAFGAFYIGDVLVHQPLPRLSRMMDLNGEVNFPTWWAAVQWFAVGALMWIFVSRRFRIRNIASWLLLPLSLIYLGFSLDEAAQIHEGLGVHVDTTIGISRTNGLLEQSGVFQLIFGTACLVAFWVLMRLVRGRFAEHPEAWRLILAGTTAMLIGAVWIDFTANFIDHASLLANVEILIEESTEFLGSTTTLWGAYILARGTTLT